LIVIVVLLSLLDFARFARKTAYAVNGATYGCFFNAVFFDGSVLCRTRARKNASSTPYFDEIFLAFRKKRIRTEKDKANAVFSTGAYYAVREREKTQVQRRISTSFSFLP